MVENARESHNNRNSRVYPFYALLAAGLLTLVGGLAYRQLILVDEYQIAAERQNFRRILTPGPRGHIYDREGRLLVGNRAVFSAAVYLNELRPEFRREYFSLVREARERHQTPDRLTLNVRARRNVVQRYLNEINRILDRNEQVDAVRIERHFSQSLLLPFPLLVDITPEEYARLIEQIPIDSPILVTTESARYYPFNDAAAHVLGYVSTTREFPFEETELGAGLLTFRQAGTVGRDGIERQMDAHLAGTVGLEIWSVDPGGFQYERIFHEVPVRGNDLVTSLDIDLQIAAERAFEDKTGAFAVLDISTGEVLALGSRPAFDLNRLSPTLPATVFNEISEAGGWLNRATQGLYPPGSTFKLVTALAAIRAGFVDENTITHCPGFHIVGNRTFRCHNRQGFGDQNLIEALRDSCNVFFYRAGLQTGIRRIADEARLFGLDSRTGLDLPGETGRMLVPDPAWKARRLHGEGWFEGDTANVSIGQGFLLLTPLQMATFVASLARGETRTQPTLIARQGGARVDHGGETIGLSPEKIELVLEGMREAGRTGTARHAGRRDMPVAGKTGTAQVRKDGRPTTLAWFVGLAPATNPRVAIAVMVEGVPDSETTFGGGSTAAPIAREVFRTYFEKASLEGRLALDSGLDTRHRAP
jgi:penicillin-binding protein 2